MQNGMLFFLELVWLNQLTWQQLHLKGILVISFVKEVVVLLHLFGCANKSLYFPTFLFNTSFTIIDFIFCFLIYFSWQKHFHKLKSSTHFLLRKRLINLHSYNCFWQVNYIHLS
jgi:hypothetical protein